MEMVQLNSLLPPEAWEGFWRISASEHEELSAYKGKKYIIFEYYCVNPSCDCQNLLAVLCEIDSDNNPFGKSVAIIKYDWSSKKTQCYPTLSDQSEKTTLALKLLEVYGKYIHTDEYIKRIKSQYARVKKIGLQNQHEEAKYTRKIGRNDFCPCGSNKKYKKCCLDR